MAAIEAYLTSRQTCATTTYCSRLGPNDGGEYRDRPPEVDGESTYAPTQKPNRELILAVYLGVEWWRNVTLHCLAWTCAKMLLVPVLLMAVVTGLKAWRLYQFTDRRLSFGPKL